MRSTYRLRGAASEQRRRIGTASMRWCVYSDDCEAIDADAAAQGAQLTLDETIAWVNRGRGPRKRPATGWDSLTPTEHSVVRLVVEGLTNAEIATRLFVSRRTVSTHLGHVFAKLGVKTRAELASAAVRQGI
jgi:DNA-binding CsgD family transcriptional regulator